MAKTYLVTATYVVTKELVVVADDPMDPEDWSFEEEPCETDSFVDEVLDAEELD